jgi:hypothetical protein
MSKKNSNLKYRYGNIIQLKFSIEEPGVENIEEFKNQLVTTIGSEITFHEKDKVLLVDILASAESEKENIEVFSLKLRHIFKLENTSTHLKRNKDGSKYFDISDEIKLMFISISYSSTRGMLKAKLADTRFSEYILPIVEPDKLMEKEPLEVINDDTQ